MFIITEVVDNKSNMLFDVSKNNIRRKGVICCLVGHCKDNTKSNTNNEGSERLCQPICDLEKIRH